MSEKKLTPKQQIFVDEYLVSLNATQSAIKAGYKQPHSQGPRLLENVGVSAAIRQAQKERGERTQIDADWVLRRAAEIADRAKESGELNAEIKAVELCGKHNGVRAFTQEQNTGQQAINISFGNMADND